jgi:predicted metal-dependent phosphoesterase TrpH
MTARQPFTMLCQQLARRPRGARVDLHIHTTCSDGTYSPAEVVDLARRSGLPAMAITDHDTTDALGPARDLAGPALEIVPGIEITTQFRGRSLHLLGYFFRVEDAGLTSLLERLRAHRLHRFREMLARLAKQGVAVSPPDAEELAGSMGRRHVAELLVKAGHAATIRQAFLRYLDDAGRVHVPHYELPVEEAVRIVRGAGGVAAWAHPSYDCTRQALAGLRDCGLQAVEVDWPSCRNSRSRELRAWAAELDLAITGGSDCHGPGNHLRAVGAHGITVEELEKLRSLATP